MILPLGLSVMGVAVAAVVFMNRDRPEWQTSIRPLLVLAIGQVVLGAVSYLLLLRR